MGIAFQPALVHLMVRILFPKKTENELDTGTLGLMIYNKALLCLLQKFEDYRSFNRSLIINIDRLVLFT